MTSNTDAHPRRDQLNFVQAFRKKSRAPKFRDFSASATSGVPMLRVGRRDGSGFQCDGYRLGAVEVDVARQGADRLHGLHA